MTVPAAAPRCRSLPRRRGPRPLGLHLQQAVLAWTGAPFAAEVLRSAVLAAPALPDTLRQRAASLDTGDLGGVIQNAARRRMAAFLAGLRAYWGHPWRRDLPDAPLGWQAGRVSLLDHGRRGTPVADGCPVLLVPSLVNRSHILDLTRERSLVRALAAAGHRPFLLDWGEPGPTERGYRLDDYVTGPLEAALDHVRLRVGRRPVVLGYCMGGLLALALAARRRRDLGGIALLATPWDFHAGPLDPARFHALVGLPAALLARALGELPVDVLQSCFAGLDPLGTPKKFVRFAAMDPDGAEARAFVALEDWVNDGVPLAGEVAAECLLDWYGANLPARGRWRVAGVPVRPETIDLPALVALPARDRIVPPASARALARALPQADIVEPAAGHIGMVVGRSAPERLYRPLAAWLGRIAAMQ